MKNWIKIIAVALVLAPSVAFAAFPKISNLILEGSALVRALILIMAGLALLAFFWGLVRFIFKAGDEKETANGKRLMIWGLVALFVMVSVWGIIRFVEIELFGTLDKNNPTIPSFQ